jgi:hypothetical protein
MPLFKRKEIFLNDIGIEMNAKFLVPFILEGTLNGLFIFQKNLINPAKKLYSPQGIYYFIKPVI